MLTSKYEELQRSARSHAEMSASMLKENDLLRYKLEEMESSTSEGEHNYGNILETPRFFFVDYLSILKLIGYVDIFMRLHKSHEFEADGFMKNKLNE